MWEAVMTEKVESQVATRGKYKSFVVTMSLCYQMVQVHSLYSGYVVFMDTFPTENFEETIQRYANSTADLHRGIH